MRRPAVMETVARLLAASCVALAALPFAPIPAAASLVSATGTTVVIPVVAQTGSFVSELVTRIQEDLFDWLDAPIVRVCAADVPVPMSDPLEDAAIPNVARIIAGIRQALA